MKLLIILLFFTNVQTVFSQDSIDWARDIEFIKNELPKKHLNLYFHESKNDYEKSLDQILLRINNTNVNKFDFLILLQQALVKLGDSHTRTDWIEKIIQLEKLPFYAYWFNDGIYVIATTKKNRKIFGKKIFKINDFPIEQIVDSIGTLFVKYNNSAIKAWAPYLINNIFLLNYFKFNEIQDTTFTITVTSNNDTLTTALFPEKLNEENSVKINYDSLAFCWKNKKYDFKEKYFEQDSIYYILYNKCVNPNDEFNKFKETVINTIKTKPIKKLIFDLRFNMGGNSLPGSILIHEILHTDSIYKKRINFYVVSGHITFSSAIIHITEFIKNSNALIVGEEPMGAPNSYGNIRYFELPTSKIKIFYSTKHFNLLNTKDNKIPLDKKIGTNYSDFKMGKDPVLEWIKNN